MVNTFPTHASAKRGLVVLGLLLSSGLVFGWMQARDADAQTKAVPPLKKDSAPAATQADKVDKTSGGIQDVVVGGGVEQIAFINEQIEKKWVENKLKPAPRASDYTFIRRATLDIIGRIAKPKEIAEYLAWPATERRSRLIDKLVKSDEYANNFANIFTNLLMTRTGIKVHSEQMQVWLMEELSKKNADWSRIVNGLLTASGKDNGDGDAPAVNFILAHLGDRVPGNPSENGQWTMVPVTSRITKLFLGLRTQCTQCHDHPFNDEWRQEHFWSMNAFLRQVEAPNGRPDPTKKKKGMENIHYELRDNAAFNQTGLVPYERRSGLVEYTKPAFLDGTKMPGKLEGSRRQELAKRVVNSPYFGKAFTNRMWGHFMGRGFTKDVDDFGEHSPISHPELLDKLATDWATKFNHNPRDLIRWICNSKAYGLDSKANATNDKSDAEPFFSRMLLKSFTPEQLFESLMTATDAKDGQNREKKRELRDQWMNKLVVQFGDDEGNEGNFNGTVVQALLMMNGQEINNAILDDSTGLVSAVTKKFAAFKGPIPRATQVVAAKELFIAALNRQPTEKELTSMLDPARMKLGLQQPLIDGPFFKSYCQDLFWALLNSNEFILNH